MGTKAKAVRVRTVSNAELARQIARKLSVAWALVHKDTNRLVDVYPARRDARFDRRHSANPKALRIRRVDLKLKGLQA